MPVTDPYNPSLVNYKNPADAQSGASGTAENVFDPSPYGFNPDPGMGGQGKGTDPTSDFAKKNAMIMALSKLAQGASKKMGQVIHPGQRGQGGPQPTTGQPGQQIGASAPAAMAGYPTPPPGSGPGSGMQPPVGAVPGRQGFQQTGTEGQFMSQLTPQAAGLFQGLQGLQQVIQTNQARKDQKDAAEAGNVAQNLMQSLDVINNSSDQQARANAMQTVDMILKNKESSKVLNKVFKGWLQKADEQKRKKNAPPDPITAGFENSLQQYFAGKQAQPPQMPSQLSGYRLPSAGPAQQMQNIAAQEEAKRAAADPKTMLKSQLSSAQMKEIEEGATLGKLEAEKAEYHARMMEAASHVQTAGLAVQLEQERIKEQQLQNQFAKQKGETEKKIADVNLLRANKNLDIANARLKLALIPKTTSAPPPTMINQLNALQEAEKYMDKILSDPKRAANGFSKEDVEQLRGLFYKGGAGASAKDLPDMVHRHMWEWLGGTGEDSVQAMRDNIHSQRSAIAKMVQERFKTWKGAGSVEAEGGVSEPEPEPDLGAGEPEGVIETPEEGGTDLPPGFVPPKTGGKP
jgi:hypothetical protein